MTQRGEAQDMSTPTTSSSRLASTIRQAAADPSIAAIVLDVDSPGGQVYGIEELGNAIYEARSSKPIAAVANSLAASAAWPRVKQVSFTPRQVLRLDRSASTPCTSTILRR